MWYLALGTPPPFTMLDSDLPAMEGASLALPNSGLPQVRTKTLAQHAAAAAAGSRISSIKCVVESTLQYTTPNILLQVQTHRLPLLHLGLWILKSPSSQRC